MRLVTFVPPDGSPRVGVRFGSALIDLAVAAPLVFEEAEDLAWDMLSVLQAEQDVVSLDSAAAIVGAVYQMFGEPPDDDTPSANGASDTGLAGSLSIGGASMILPLNQVRLLAPLPRPASLRIFDVFEPHMLTVRGLRNQAAAPEWYRFPAFAFANHGAIVGSDHYVQAPRCDALDYELQLACVIGRSGRDIALEDAANYIAGYTILNAWTARDIQADERAVGLGMAKANDFATSLGPWLVTPDDLEIYADEDGRLSLTMVARVNAVERSRGNAAGMYYTFAEMIAHASRNTTLHPGDLLASGAVGGGSLEEQTAGYGPWLASGDLVELEVTGLGVLCNTID